MAKFDIFTSIVTSTCNLRCINGGIPPSLLPLPPTLTEIRVQKVNIWDPPEWERDIARAIKLHTFAPLHLTQNIYALK